MIKFHTFTTLLFSAALFVNPLIASNDDSTIELRVAAKAGSALGQLIQGNAKGVYTVTPANMRRALTAGYTPAKGEPSVIDLINKYYIYGEMDKFYKEVAKLSDRGNPVAWGYHGWYVANSDMAKKGKTYQRGLELMRRAGAAGVASADNNEAMMLWMDHKESLARKFLAHGVADPHDLSNYGLILEDQKEPVATYLPVLMRAAEAGDVCAAGALAEYYSQEGKDQNLAEALKWYFISYHGSSSMDQFDGFESVMNFYSSYDFAPKDVKRAKQAAKTWIETHPQIMMDGFDMIRLGAQAVYATQPDQALEGETDSVAALFWTYYAKGDKVTFDAALEPFLAQGDANAFFMKAHLLRGFVGSPNLPLRRHYLELAVAKSHPLAFLELAMDLWIDSATTLEEHKKQDLQRHAAELLLEGYDTWSSTKHVGAIGELMFFLGYFIEYGIGFDEPDQDRANRYYRQAFYWTPLVAGHLGQQISTSDPVKSCAYLTVARTTYIQGDWFGGVHHWQKAMMGLKEDQLLEAQKMAKAIEAKSLGLTWNFYQRMTAGLDEDFSGINN